MGLMGIGPLLVNHWGGIRWLLRDEFNDTRAAGATNGRPATPGPGGNMEVTDTDGDGVSVSGDALVFANPNSVWGNPGAWLPLPITTRAGILAAMHVNFSNTGFAQCGLDNARSGESDGPCFNIAPNVGTYARAPGPIQIHSGPLVLQAVDYDLAILLGGATGVYYFLRGGVFTYPELVGMDRSVVPATAYMGIAAYSGTLTSKYWHVVQSHLPTPAAYDTFARLDGPLGSTETVGIDGQSVAALPYTVVSGVAAISTNKAVLTTAGIVTLDVGEGDLVYELSITTPAAGVTPGGMLLRYTDTDNYWYVKITPGTAGTDFQLISRAAGVETVRASADVDWSANTEYKIRVICRSSTFWYVWVDNIALAKLVYTGNTTLNMTATRIGFMDEGNSNMKFARLLAMPKGTGGEYSYMERFF